MSMSDVAGLIEVNEQEIRDYIQASMAEKEKLMMRLDELDQGIRNAETDLHRCDRAKMAITGDDEPPSKMIDLRDVQNSAVRAKPQYISGDRP